MFGDRMVVAVRSPNLWEFSFTIPLQRQTVLTSSKFWYVPRKSLFVTTTAASNGMKKTSFVLIMVRTVF